MRSFPVAPLDEVRDWLNRAAVVAVPSVTAANGDSEGLPTVILEAQAMEAPVVATRHSGIPEGMSAGLADLLVGERDSKALAHSLLTLLKDPQSARDVSDAPQGSSCPPASTSRDRPPDSKTSTGELMRSNQDSPS